MMYQKLTFFFLLWEIVSAQHEVTVCNDPIVSSSDLIQLKISGNSCQERQDTYPAAFSDFCFNNGSFYSNSFEIRTQYPFLLRRIAVSAFAGGESRFPDFIRLSASLGGGSLEWFKTPLDQDTGAAWSRVPVHGDIFDIGDAILPFSSLSIWPSTVNATKQMRFGARLFGCQLEATGNVSYIFLSSSKKSIQTAFSGLSFFKSRIAHLISETTRIDPARYVVEAYPQTDGNVTVAVVVLPDAAPEAKSVEILVSELSTNPKLLTALHDLQRLIIDHSPSMCVGKTCPFGQVCILGKCASRIEGLSTEAFSNPQSSGGNMRRILASAPQIKGPAHQSLRISARHLVTILIGASFFLVLAVIGLIRVYKRTKVSSTEGELE